MMIWDLILGNGTELKFSISICWTLLTKFSLLMSWPVLQHYLWGVWGVGNCGAALADEDDNQCCMQRLLCTGYGYDNNADTSCMKGSIRDMPLI